MISLMCFILCRNYLKLGPQDAVSLVPVILMPLEGSV